MNKQTTQQTEQQSQTVTIQTTEQESQSKNKNTNPSIITSIQECERFFNFLNMRFKLNLDLNDLIVTIHETPSNVKGFFRQSDSLKTWIEDLTFKHQNTNTDPFYRLHNINLSSHNLQIEPYETLAHEFAHYLNVVLDKYTNKGNNYHTTDFKKRAEQLLLRVERGTYGFNVTYETEEFKNMVNNEFKPNPQAFKIFQETEEQRYRRLAFNPDGTIKLNPDGTPLYPEPEPKKSKSRMLKYMCSCGVIIRSARNEDKPLKALCQYCNTPFIEQSQEENKKQ